MSARLWIPWADELRRLAATGSIKESWPESGSLYSQMGWFMLELNVITAIPVGTFAAFVWSGVLLRRLLRAPRADRLSRNQKLVVYLTGAIALVPALIVGFVFAGFLSRITVVPGVWSHLALALTMVFGLAVMGTVIPVAAGWAVAKGLLRRSTRDLG